LGQGQSIFGQGWSKLVQGWSIFGQGWSNLVQRRSKLGQGQSKLVQGWSILGQRWSNLVQGRSSVGQGKSNFAPIRGCFGHGRSGFGPRRIRIEPDQGYGLRASGSGHRAPGVGGTGTGDGQRWSRPGVSAWATRAHARGSVEQGVGPRELTLAALLSRACRAACATCPVPLDLTSRPS